MSFRTNLQCLRAERHMTQEQLAMLLGVSRQSVTKWEAEKSYPEMDKLIKMCQIFECSLDDLVQGDLTDRDPVPVAATVPSGPATDVCGYDEHMRKYSKHVPTGVASFVLGIVGLVFFEEASGTPGFFNGGIALGWSELLGLGALFLGVLAGIGILVSSGMEHSAFVKAHPFIEDFYTEEERLQARQLLVKGVIAGLGSIFAGVMLCAFVERESGAGWAAAAVLFLLVAIGVWMIVYAGMMYDRIDIADYNRSAAEELEMEDIARIDVPEAVRDELRSARRTHKKIEAICGVIMLVATIIALTWLFMGPSLAGTTWDAIDAGHAAVDSPVSYFWLPWMVGGILCAIVTIVIKALDGD